MGGGGFSPIPSPQQTPIDPNDEVPPLQSLTAIATATENESLNKSRKSEVGLKKRISKSSRPGSDGYSPRDSSAFKYPTMSARISKNKKVSSGGSLSEVCLCVFVCVCHLFIFYFFCVFVRFVLYLAVFFFALVPHIAILRIFSGHTCICALQPKKSKYTII